MTIEELTKLKTRLEYRIKDLIKDFNEESPIFVTDVEITNITFAGVVLKNNPSKVTIKLQSI